MNPVSTVFRFNFLFHLKLYENFVHQQIGVCRITQIPLNGWVGDASEPHDKLSRGEIIKSKESINYKCIADYFIDGPSTNDCFQGQWRNSMPKCEPMCIDTEELYRCIDLHYWSLINFIPFSLDVSIYFSHEFIISLYNISDCERRLLASQNMNVMNDQFYVNLGIPKLLFDSCLSLNIQIKVFETKTKIGFGLIYLFKQR